MEKAKGFFSSQFFVENKGREISSIFGRGILTTQAVTFRL